MAGSPDSRKKVLILGGGFAGIGAARKLKDANVDVELVDRHNYHTFQPLLYQVATDLLEQSSVGHPLRDLFHDQENVTVRQDVATGIDLEKRRVTFEGMKPRSYDYLVVGLGAAVNFFDTPGAAENAFPMYTLADAVRLRTHVLERWEAADKDPDLIEGRCAQRGRRRRRRDRHRDASAPWPSSTGTSSPRTTAASRRSTRA